MANTVICSELTSGFDLSCVRNVSKSYYQQAVIINFNDIDQTASIDPVLTPTCTNEVTMILKSAKKGWAFILPDNGNSIKGYFEKTTTDKGIVEYLHKIDILIDEAGCKLDSLDHGRFVVALQRRDGVVEIYGWFNGLVTSDYTFDRVEGGGLPLITLNSTENSKEGLPPLIYKATAPSTAEADFNVAFLQP